MKKENVKVQSNKKEKKIKKSTARKRMPVILFGVIIMIALGVGALFLLGKGKGGLGGTKGEPEQGLMSQMPGGNESAASNIVGNLSDLQGKMVAAYGVVSVGSKEESFPIENAEGSLVIEEVYVATGNTVSSETKLVKFTQSSLDAMEKELEDAYREAELAYRAGVIEYEQSKIQLEYERDMALLEGEQAQAVYESTISSLDSSVKRASEQLTETKTQISEYKAALNNNTYYKEVEACQALYDENLELLKKYMEQWGVSWQQVTAKGGATPGNFRTEQDQYQYILRNLYSVLESNEKALSEAKSAYEDAVANANLELQTLEISLPELEKTYAEAEQSYETMLLQANLTKETSLAEAQTAEKTYEAGLEKAQAEYDSLEDAYELAKEDLEAFRTRIVDGVYYAETEGELMRFNLRAGQRISSSDRVFTVRDTTNLTVTVSVAQEDIAKVAVGDSAIMQNTDGGIYQGVVESVNPVSSSSSQSSVSYNVTVKITSGAENAQNSETVTVYFGLGGLMGIYE